MAWLQVVEYHVLRASVLLCSSFVITMNIAQHEFISNATVHVVDDEGMHDSLYRLLERAGYLVRLHGNGLRFLQDYDGVPGCVIFDLVMPGMSGELLLEEIYRRQLNVAVIVVTGHATVEAAIRIMRAGAFDILQKPFDNARLLSGVRSALERARPKFARQALRMDYQCRLELLTPSERAVMELILAGLTSQEIAGRLGNSKKTIDIHRARVIKKMGVGSTAELIKSSISLGG